MVTEIQMTCPKCMAAEPITIVYIPGTPTVFYLPNGDPGYPGDPPEVEVRANCNCWSEIYNNPEEVSMLESLVTAWLAFGYYRQEEAMYEQMYQDIEGN